ncbi:MAG TPA: hypothetical protein VG106_15345 [Vicinamibacterales bacterium]|nr:hypothetical protein [Vicinamibacterales bacterium]
MRFVARTVSTVDKLSAFATVLLVVCAIALLVVPDAVSFLTGKTSVAPIAPPDELSPSAAEDATPFLIRRNVVEITVSEEMTVRRLLELYRLNKPDQTRQVFEQLGKNATPNTIVRRGTRLRIVLTPTAGDVPGASPRERPQ